MNTFLRECQLGNVSPSGEYISLAGNVKPVGENNFLDNVSPGV